MRNRETREEDKESKVADVEEVKSGTMIWE
jgi:hypothetical protein